MGPAAPRGTEVGELYLRGGKTDGGMVISNFSRNVARRSLLTVNLMCVLLVMTRPPSSRLGVRSFFLVFVFVFVCFQVALNGQLGLDMLYARPTFYDLVLLDIIMPGLDGIEVPYVLCLRHVGVLRVFFFALSCYCCG